MQKKDVVKLIAALVILALLLIFAFQNYHQRARVKVFFWQTERMPVSIIIFASVLAGALIACIELIPPLVKYRRRALKAESELSDMEKSTEKQSLMK